MNVYTKYNKVPVKTKRQKCGLSPQMWIDLSKYVVVFQMTYNQNYLSTFIDHDNIFYYQLDSLAVQALR